MKQEPIRRDVGTDQSASLVETLQALTEKLSKADSEVEAEEGLKQLRQIRTDFLGHETGAVNAARRDAEALISWLEARLEQLREQLARKRRAQEGEVLEKIAKQREAEGPSLVPTALIDAVVHATMAADPEKTTSAAPVNEPAKPGHKDSEKPNPKKEKKDAQEAHPAVPTPETPSPEPLTPETPSPEPLTPEPPTPETPTPETPTPETPTPETPTPETPTPETPTPETPTPETPAPERLTPETPAPETPTPETPAPKTPKPESPTPETQKSDPPKPERQKDQAVALKKPEAKKPQAAEPGKQKAQQQKPVEAQKPEWSKAERLAAHMAASTREDPKFFDKFRKAALRSGPRVNAPADNRAGERHLESIYELNKRIMHIDLQTRALAKAKDRQDALLPLLKATARQINGFMREFKAFKEARPEQAAEYERRFGGYAEQFSAMKPEKGKEILEQCLAERQHVLPAAKAPEPTREPILPAAKEPDPTREPEVPQLVLKRDDWQQ